MGGFSDGDLVWGPSLKSGTSMWPAVVIRARSEDDPAKCLICYVSKDHNNLDDIRSSKIFSKERSSLYLFDPRSTTKFAPDKDNRLLSRQFDQVVNLSIQLFEERKRQVQEEYQRLVEQATQRSKIADANESPPTIELKAGAHIFFWIPGMIAGRDESQMYARVLTVHHPSRYLESKIPLELDSGHVLTLDDSVKMLKPTETKLMPLRRFKLITSSVTGVTISDMICQSVQDHIDTLKAENPAYAHMFRDPFGNTRKPEVGKQEAKDADYTPTAKKKPKKKKPEATPIKDQTPKSYDVPRERPGWKPNCHDSEDEEAEKKLFMPILTVPNRPQSQKTSTRPNPEPTSTPSRPKSKPNVFDSDAEDSDNARKRPASQTSRLRTPTSARSKSKPDVVDSGEDEDGPGVKRKRYDSLAQKRSPFVPISDRSESKLGASGGDKNSSGRRASNMKAKAALKKKKRKSSTGPKELASNVNTIHNYFPSGSKGGDDVSRSQPECTKEESSQLMDLTQTGSEGSDCKEHNLELTQLSLSDQDADQSDKDLERFTSDDSGLLDVPLSARFKKSQQRRRRSVSRDPDSRPGSVSPEDRDDSKWSI